jgi:multiple sugar transport system ATP-binding protein
MYSLVDVHKRYGLKTVALRKINLEIEDREFCVLYGPAGAGKSTVLNLFAGITQPTRGDVRRDGHSIAHLPPERRDAAMAFENYALYSHLSVYENLAFPLRAARLKRADIQSRVKKISEVLGISQVLDRRPGMLSGGQRQRVALGRAIVRPASIYLLDEPIGHLDAKLRHRMRAELKALAAELDATVLFTTTSSKEALALADKLAVLNQGRLEQVGSPSDLYHSPANTFVASFLGDPPMSFLSVTTRPAGDVTEIQAIGGAVIARTTGQLAADRRLQAGVRSSAILLKDPDAEGVLPGRIGVVEHLGYTNIAVVHIGDDSLSVSLPADVKANAGQNVGLTIDSGQVHLFEGTKALNMETH